VGVENAAVYLRKAGALRLNQRARRSGEKNHVNPSGPRKKQSENVDVFAAI